MTSTSVLEPLEALGALPPTAEPQVRWPALPWPARVLDTLSSYLPMLLMGLLALGSWWLVKNTPLPEAPRGVESPRHEPDYTMRQFSIQRFAPDGRLRAQVEGEALRHYPDTDTFEIEQPRVRSHAQGGGATSGSARSALSNSDATEVQLLGDAQVTRTATAGDEGLSFRGEFLQAFLKAEQVRSHLPATVTRGGTVIRADTFSYDNLDRTVSMKGRVRASFAAPAAKAGPGTRSGPAP